MVNAPVISRLQQMRLNLKSLMRRAMRHHAGWMVLKLSRQ